MANQLIQKGTSICEIIKHKINLGRRSVERTPSIGSQDEIIPGNKEPDRVVIEISVGTNFNFGAGDHEVLINGIRYRFTPDKESTQGGRIILEGFILSVK